jgi:hypothetical protein
LFDLISRNDCWASPDDEDYRSDVFPAFEATALRRLGTRIRKLQSGRLLLGLGLDGAAKPSFSTIAASP